MKSQPNARNMITSGLLLGIGLGGFIDGILFHQLLQVHNMLSAKYPTRDLEAPLLVENLELNMFWDGLFHILCWVMTSAGLALLWQTLNRREVHFPSTAFAGSLLLGWGLFNFVEGIINHHLLHIHHVTETADHLLWDLTFLGSGLVLILLGTWMITTAWNRWNPAQPDRSPV